MFYPNNFVVTNFKYCCAVFTLMVFIAGSLYSDEYSKGLLGYSDPTKKIDKYVDELSKYNAGTSFEDLSKFMISFKKFSEKQIGRKVSFEEIYHDIQKQIKQLNIPLESKIVKSCLSRLLKTKISKGKLPANGEKIDINPQIVIGCVYLACCPLVLAIGYAMPLAAPFCYGTAAAMAGQGLTLISNGLCEDEKKRFPRNYTDTFSNLDMKLGKRSSLSIIYA